MSRIGQASSLAFALLTGLAPACSERDATPPAPPTRVVDFYLNGNTLRSLGELPALKAPSTDVPIAEASMLPWTFTGPNGAVLASGATPDVRSATSEFAEDGRPQPLGVTLPWMMFSLRLPADGGTLNVYNARPATAAERAAGGVAPRDWGFKDVLASVGLVGAGYDAQCPRDRKPCTMDVECRTPGCNRFCYQNRCVAECEGVEGGNHQCMDKATCQGKSGARVDYTWSCSGASGGGDTCCDIEPDSPLTAGTFALDDILSDPTNVKNIRPSNAQCPYNIVMVSEAYQNQAAFDQRAGTLADAVRQDPDWAPYAESLSFWTSFFFSSDHRISDPQTKLSTGTAFGAAFGEGPSRRGIALEDLPDGTAKALREVMRKTQADLIMVLLNTREHGGVASSLLGVRYVTIADTSDQTMIAGHEMGHAILHLNDEYAYDNEKSRCDLRWAESPNTSAHLDNLPWKSMVTNPLPTPSGASGVGAFEGAAYCPTGVYRPTDRCRMRELRTHEFCPVCAAQLKKVFASSQSAPKASKGALTPAGGVALVRNSGDLICRHASLMQ